MREYFRNGPEHRGGADVSFADIVQLFGFYSVRIGRWVTAAEQQRAANLFFDALCDLQQLLQVPNQVLSLRGTLALHYGIGGRRALPLIICPMGGCWRWRKTPVAAVWRTNGFMPLIITSVPKCSMTIRRRCGLHRGIGCIRRRLTAIRSINV